MMGDNTRNMYSCLQKYNKLNKSHLVGQLLNSIQDARTHVHKKKIKRKATNIHYAKLDDLLTVMNKIQISQDNTRLQLKQLYIL